MTSTCPSSYLSDSHIALTIVRHWSKSWTRMKSLNPQTTLEGSTVIIPVADASWDSGSGSLSSSPWTLHRVDICDIYSASFFWGALGRRLNPVFGGILDMQRTGIQAFWFLHWERQSLFYEPHIENLSRNLYFILHKVYEKAEASTQEKSKDTWGLSCN